MTAPVVQIESPLQRSLPEAIRIILAARARKDQQAANFVSSLPEGATFGQIAANSDLAKQFKRHTGVEAAELPQDDFIKPPTIQGILAGGIQQMLTANPQLAQQFGASAAQTITGGARGQTTPGGLAAQGRAGAATARAQARVAEAGETAVGQAPEGQVQALGLNQIFGTQPEVQQALVADADLRRIQTQTVVDAMSDPQAIQRINRALPAGLTVGDAMFATSTGMDRLISQNLAISAQLAEAAQEDRDQLLQAQKEVATDMGKRFDIDPTRIIAYWNGQENALTPDQRELISRGSAAGLAANLVKRMREGDPALASFNETILPLFRQFGSDLNKLEPIMNLTRSILNDAYGTDVLPKITQKRTFLENVLRIASFFNINPQGVPQFVGGESPVPTPATQGTTTGALGAAATGRTGPGLTLPQALGQEPSAAISGLEPDEQQAMGLLIQYLINVGAFNPQGQP